MHGKGHPKDPECNCGVCLSCGGWAAPWKPEWWQRLDTWWASLSTPCLETGSEAETLSTACTSEVDSEWRDQLDALLANESDSEVKTASTPCLETDSEAETPSTAYTSEVDSEWGDQLDALIANESDSEVETVSVPSVAPSRRSARITARPPICCGDPMQEVLEPTRQLDRFHTQLTREGNFLPLDITIDNELFQYVESQL